MDMAIKFARQVAFARGQRQRTRLFSLMPSYHGGTLATLAVSGDETLEAVLDGIAVSSEKIPAPLSYRPPDGLTPEQNEARIIALFERRLAELGPETALAMLVEPVGGLASGANVLSAQFLAGIAEVCRRHGIFLIFDEVMSGAGRTGRFLAAHRHPRSKRDIVVLAKGLSGGYAPLGAMLAPAALVDPLAEELGFNYAHTANANPIACAVGVAVLEELEQGDLLQHAEALGAYLRGRVLDMAQRVPVIGDIRGQGLLMVVEIVAERAGRTPLPSELNAPSAIRRIGLDHGLMIYARRTSNGRFGDWFMLSPPLVTVRQEADEIVERLERTLTEFTDGVVRAGMQVST
jgi:adenosylmethionine-8-amino-7-oxononanoate aminotransferase